MSVHVIATAACTLGRRRVAAGEVIRKTGLADAERFARRARERWGVALAIEVAAHAIARVVAKDAPALPETLCRCGHPLAEHVNGPLTPCTYGRGGFFGGCPCSRFRRRGYTVRELRADAMRAPALSQSEGDRST